MAELTRKLGIWTAVAVIIGQVIGVGIFLVPAGMAKSVGSPVWLFGIWALVGFMTLCGALCYSEFAARFPEAGGSYIYLREAFGRGTAFVYGWMVLLVVDPGLTAIFGVGLATYASIIFELSSVMQTAVAISSIVIIGVLTIAGTGVSAGFLRIITYLKVSALLFLVFYGIVSGRGDWENLEPIFSTPTDIYTALSGGLVGAFFAFAGWWEVTRMAGEVRDPERNVPITLLLGIVGLTTIYMLTSAVFMYLVPIENVVNDEAFASLAGEALFGPIGGVVFAGIVCVSVAGTLLAYLLVSPRTYFAMARDGLFFDIVGRLHPRFGTPYIASIIQISIAVIMVLSGSFREILGYFFFLIILFVGITVGGLLRLPRYGSENYKVPLFPLPVIIYLVLTVFVLFFVALGSPFQTTVGVVVVSVGIPVYHLFFKRSTERASNEL